MVQIDSTKNWKKVGIEKLNILTDYLGHEDLYYSLVQLFEKRLGGQLFCPDNEGDWHKFINLQPAIVGYDKSEFIDGVYYYHRKMEPNDGHYIQKAISFKKFLEMDIDVILTTYFGHEQAFYDLIKKYKPNAIFVRYVFCCGERPLGYCKNILHTAHERPKDWSSDINYLKYLPENRKEFCYIPPISHNSITSFFNYLTTVSEELNNWNRYKSALREFVFRMYGDNADLIYNGYIPYLWMPRATQEVSFVWHPKPWGGGGYIANQALSCGRPLIMRRKYLQQWNELLLGFLQDSVNCIDLDARSFEENVNLIKEWAEPSRHIEICKNVAEGYNRFVNHERQAEEVKTFLANAKRGV